MNKNELATVVAEKLEITKKNAIKVIDATVESIKEALMNDEKVSFTNFGSFELVDVAEKNGIVAVGSKKGESFSTPAHKKPKFRFSGGFKDEVKKVTTK